MSDVLQSIAREQYGGPAGPEREPSDSTDITSFLRDRVRARFERAKRARRSRELTWYLNLAFYLGDHYAVIDGTKQTINSGTRTKVPAHRVRAVFPRIKSAVNHMVASMVKARPTFTASPMTEDPEDIDGARIASSALLHEWKRACLTEEDHDLKLWKAITGTAGFWTRWDETQGYAEQDPETNELQPPQGEIDGFVVPPFNLYPDPDATRLSNASYFIHASEENIADLKEAFPERAHLIGRSGSHRDRAGHYERKLRQMMGDMLSGSQEVLEPGETTTLIIYWEPRSSHFPNGVMVIMTPDVVLWAHDNRWAHFGSGKMWCPVELFYHHRLSASIWGDSAIGDAIPLQMELNKTLSQVFEHRNMMTRGRYWIPRGCKVDPSQMNGEPSEKVFYDPTPPERSAGGRAYRPEREDPPPFPQGHMRMLVTLSDAIADVINHHAVSQGKTEPGLRTGVAIEALQEKDESPNVPVAERDNQGWARVGRRWLQLIHDQWSEARIIQVRGEDGYTETRAFRGADIPANLDIEVDTDILLPSSRAARTNALIALTQYGVLDRAEARQALFGGFGTIRAAIAKASRDESQQRRENALMAQGQPVEVNNFDNHLVGMTVLNDFRKTAYFERIRKNPTMIPKGIGPDGMPVMATVGDLFELHQQAHAQALMAQGPMALMGATGMPQPSDSPGSEQGAGNGEQRQEEKPDSRRM
uniref:Putative portal protein n=1 Tax=viral metagenome TaxID=1070528 RepID=A0A6M3IP60_9ZZZZ